MTVKKITVTPEMQERLTRNTIAVSERIGGLLAGVIRDAPLEQDRAELIAELAAGALAASAMLSALSGMTSAEAAAQFGEGVHVCSRVPLDMVLGSEFKAEFTKLRETFRRENDPEAN